MAFELPASQNVLRVAGSFNDAAEITELRLDDGRMFRVPTSMLVETNSSHAVVQDNLVAGSTDEQILVPVIEEHLTVGKRIVPTGTVRLHKTVQEFETALNEPLAVRTFDVERVILNQPIEEAPGVRQESNTTIYPLVEEQLILPKQRVLKEEIRVTKRDTERIDTQTVTLRREHIEVERDQIA